MQIEVGVALWRYGSREIIPFCGGTADSGDITRELVNTTKAMAWRIGSMRMVGGREARRGGRSANWRPPQVQSIISGEGNAGCRDNCAALKPTNSSPWHRTAGSPWR